MTKYVVRDSAERFLGDATDRRFAETTARQAIRRGIADVTVVLAGERIVTLAQRDGCRVSVRRVDR
jgi:hypothetical protein